LLGLQLRLWYTDYMTDNELIVYGASDDLVEFDGVFYEEYNTSGAEWFGQVTDANGEYLRLHVSYGQDGVEWKLRAENPFGWDIEVTERPDRDSDPALSIITPTGDVDVEEFEEIWENPSFTVVAT
jgi:hypothetical protein